MSKIADRLIQRAEELRNQPVELVQFTNDLDADRLLNDIHHHPHLFVLACVMDQQVKAERAWMIPVIISREIGKADFDAFSSLEADWLQAVFQGKGLHRFNERTARWFYLAIQRIRDVYRGDASRIWRDEPSSATVVRRFLRFEGVGPKIATMATNILARDFRIPMSDKISVDISADVHAKRVFYRLGLSDVKNDEADLIYAARELNPEYPGIFDFIVWDIGRNRCKEIVPLCSQCYMNDLCPKIGVERFS